MEIIKSGNITIFNETEDVIIRVKQNDHEGQNGFIFLNIRNESDSLLKTLDINGGYLKTIELNILPGHTKKIKIENPFFETYISNAVHEKLSFTKNVLDMTDGTPWKLILIFAIPIFISQLFQTLYNIVDSLIVGNLIGKNALAAVSSSGSLIHLLTSFFLGTAMGAGVLISKYFGAGKYKDMSRAIHTNVALGLISSVILTLVGVLFTPTILKWMGTDPDVLPDSINYFRYYFLGCIAIVMYNIFNGILNAVGNSRRPLYYLIISSLLNVFLDYFFIGILNLKDVKYAAIATTISQFFSAILCFVHLIKKENIYHIQLSNIRIEGSMLKEIVAYGVPNGVQNSVIGLANVIVQSNINVFGADAMAGSGSYFKIESMVFVPIQSFTMALQTYISQNIGAKKFDRVKKGSRFGIISVCILAEILGISFYILAPNLIKLYNDDPSVVYYGTLHFRTTALFFFLLAFSHAISSVLRGAGRTVIPMLVMLIVWCGIRVSYITVIMHFTDNIRNIYWAYPLTWAISSLFYVVFYYRSDWVHYLENRGKS